MNNKPHLRHRWNDGALFIDTAKKIQWRLQWCKCGKERVKPKSNQRRDRLAEAIRKHKFDDVKLWQALQPLNQDHTVAANDMIADVKGGSDEIPR